MIRKWRKKERVDVKERKGGRVIKKGKNKEKIKLNVQLEKKYEQVLVIVC